MKKENLLLYELPTIAEFISIEWMHEVVAQYAVWKVNRKWKRYLYRLNRAKWVEEYKLSKGIR